MDSQQHTEHENETARLRREHSQMVAALQDIVKYRQLMGQSTSGANRTRITRAALAFQKMLDNAENLLSAIASTPPSEPAPVVAQGTGERYKVVELMGYASIQFAEENPFQGLLYPSVAAAEFAIAYHENQKHAALPASAAAGDEGAES